MRAWRQKRKHETFPFSLCRKVIKTLLKVIWEIWIIFDDDDEEISEKDTQEKNNKRGSKFAWKRRKRNFSFSQYLLDKLCLRFFLLIRNLSYLSHSPNFSPPSLSKCATNRSTVLLTEYFFLGLDFNYFNNKFSFIFKMPKNLTRNFFFHRNIFLISILYVYVKKKKRHLRN